MFNQNLMRGQINEADLIEALQIENGLPVSEAMLVVDVFFVDMLEALARGDRFEIRALKLQVFHTLR